LLCRPCLGFRVSGFGFRVSGLGFRVRSKGASKQAREQASKGASKQRSKQAREQGSKQARKQGREQAKGNSKHGRRGPGGRSSLDLKVRLLMDGRSKQPWPKGQAADRVGPLLP
jgi:hypothetical protein